MERTRMTTQSGLPVADNQNSLTAGPRGPILIEDVHLIEKLAQFNRERVPERVVHAKGAGAHGTFRVTGDITPFTTAHLFARVGRETPVFARFSTVAGELGSADTARDPRGFAVKFYTEQGNWDMVGNNTPVFFVRDPLKFSDFIHSQKRDPGTGLRSPTMQWDFWSRSPESLHQVTILFSDRGIPDGYRHMNGYSSHTFSLVNGAGERFWVKWHFKTLQGIQNLAPDVAARLAGADPDYATRDLYAAIGAGDFPRWRVLVQVMPEADAATYRIHPFDLTQVWPHGDYPLIEVGILELNRNPDNVFAEVEQAAFEPANVVPGMGYSPDKMLGARLFAYPDAHRYRIGTNYALLPINRPQSAVHTYHRDGAMRLDANGGADVAYEPNGMGGPTEDPTYRQPPLALAGDAARYDRRVGTDDYSQAGDLFRLLSAQERQRLIANIATAMAGVPQAIQRRQVAHFLRADRRYGEGVAAALGLTGVGRGGGAAADAS
jgi:catalase